MGLSPQPSALRTQARTYSRRVPSLRFATLNRGARVWDKQMFVVVQPAPSPRLLAATLPEYLHSPFLGPRMAT